MDRLLRDADSLTPRGMLQNDERLVQTLQSEIPVADALRVVGGKSGPTDFGLELSKLMVQRPKAAFVHVLEQQRSHEDHPFGDIFRDRRETFTLQLEFGHEGPFPLGAG